MNGYITIKINGQSVGLKFAYPAIKWFSEEAAKSDLMFVPGEDGGFTVEGLAKLMQCAYKNDCLLKEVEPTLKHGDFYDYIEVNQETDEGQKELLKVIDTYASSSVMKRVADLQKKSQTQ
jgi:hypothetical protein